MAARKNQEAFDFLLREFEAGNISTRTSILLARTFSDIGISSIKELKIRLYDAPEILHKFQLPFVDVNHLKILLRNCSATTEEPEASLDRPKEINHETLTLPISTSILDIKLEERLCRKLITQEKEEIGITDASKFPFSIMDINLIDVEDALHNVGLSLPEDIDIEVVCSAAILGPVIDKLKEDSSNEFMVGKVCLLIGSLCYGHDQQCTLGQLGAPELLTDLLIEHFDSPATIESALKAIRLLSYNDTNVASMVEYGLVEALVSLFLAPHQLSSPILALAFDVLRRVGGIDLHVPKIIETELLEVLCRVLLKRRDFKATVGMVVALLGSLASQSLIGSSLSKAPSLPEIFVVMQTYLSSATIVASYSTLIKNFVSHVASEELTARYRPAFADLLASALEMHSDPTVDREVCLAVQSVCSACPEYASLFGDRGVCELVVQALGRSVEAADEGGSLVCIEALSCLVQDNGLNQTATGATAISHYSVSLLTEQSATSLSVLRLILQLCGTSSASGSEEEEDIGSRNAARLVVARTPAALLHLLQLQITTTRSSQAKGVATAVDLEWVLQLVTLTCAALAILLPFDEAAALTSGYRASQDVLELFGDQEAVVVEALQLLRTLLDCEPRAEAADLGALPTLVVRALRSQVQSTVVCIAACGAVVAMCPFQQQTELLVSSGVSDAISTLFSVHKSDECVVEAAARAVKTLLIKLPAAVKQSFGKSCTLSDNIVQAMNTLNTGGASTKQMEFDLLFCIYQLESGHRSLAEIFPDETAVAAVRRLLSGRIEKLHRDSTVAGLIVGEESALWLMSIGLRDGIKKTSAQ